MGDGGAGQYPDAEPVSAAGFVRAHGATVTIRRSTRARQVPGDGSSTATWADAAAGVKLFVELASQEKAQLLFGREKAVTAIGTAELGPDFQPDDGVVVTAVGRNGAWLTGLKFHVRGVVPKPSGPGLKLVGLEVTQETF